MEEDNLTLSEAGIFGVVARCNRSKYPVNDFHSCFTATDHCQAMAVKPIPERLLDVPDKQARELEKQRPFIRKVVRLCGVPEADLEDVTQVALIKVLVIWKNRQRLNMALDADDPEFSSFVYAIVSRVAMAHRKRKERRETLEEAEWFDNCLRDSGIDPRPTPLQELLEVEQEEQLSALLDELSEWTEPRRMRVFYAHFILNLPMSTIADAEHIPIGTAYTRSRQARIDIRRAYARDAISQRFDKFI
ncbi:MAG: RNA polymerase sigma factor [Polyangiaceae bacterium]|nr:RNA polymerase sigma factor [Polyangiaceae bacterium]